MRKEAGLMCVFTCVMGALGLFLRWIQNNNVFEPETGLAQRGSAWSGLLVAVCVITALGILGFVANLRGHKTETQYRTALRGKTILYPALAGVLGAVMLVGAVMLLTTAGDQPFPGLQRVLAVLAAACGACLPLLAVGPKKDSDGSMMCLGSFVPVVFLCFWLIVSYKENSANPVVWAYCIEILAISAAIMAYYYTAGFAFEKPRPLSTIYFCLLGAFFSMTTLADTRPVSKQLFFVAIAVMLLAFAFVLVSNMTRRSRRIQE